MRATVTVVHDPFHPLMNREFRVLDRVALIRDLAPTTDKPFICLRNGEAVLRRHWDEPVLDGEMIAFITLPQGGGHGGSNPLRLILSIAVMVIAPQLLPTGFLGGAGAIGYEIAKAGIIMAGMAVVNALVPVKMPSQSFSGSASLPSASPTYNIQAQGNMARIEAPIPDHYGRLRFFPDFGAQPYAEYSGNEQFLYQLFVIGQGQYDIETIQIEDTPIDNWEDIAYEVVPPGGALTLFPSNVATSGEVAGQDTQGLKSGTYSQSGTTITVTISDHLVTPGTHVLLTFTSGTGDSGSYVVVTAPTIETFTVTSASSETTSGTCTMAKFLGPYVASAPATVANFLGVDVVFPQGLFYFDSNGNMNQVSVSFVVQACAIDDFGAEVGSWFTLATRTISAATTTPQRYSYRYATTAARYKVRFARTSVEPTGSGYSSSMSWAGLRAYLPNVTEFGDVTLLAMRLKASNQLTIAASRKINVIATRKLPTWQGETLGWSEPVVTRSPAWAIANMLRASYGGGMPDSRIDLEGLKELDATWAGRGDYLDQRFDSATTLWAAITEAALVGRARPYMQGGIVHLKRDQPQTLPIAMYSMRNIEKGSFGIDYLLTGENTADAVEVTYYDEVSWMPERVVGKVPDSNATKPAKITMLGITSREQAMREATYHATVNRYRREVIHFATEMEGFIPAYGDLIIVQHDMPAWGQSAEVVGWDADTRTLTLSEPMTFSTGTHYIGMRQKDGGVVGPAVVTAGATPYELVIDPDSPYITPYTGRDYERTFITFGWGETWRKLALVTFVKPRNLEQVEIECITEDATVHTADVGVFAPPVQSSQLPTLYTAPVVAGLIGRNAPDDLLKVMLSWESAPGAEYYIVEQSADNIEWSRVTETRANNCSFTALFGSATIIRVAAVGLTRGPWVTLHYGGVADYMWDANPAALMWDANDLTLMWR